MHAISQFVKSMTLNTQLSYYMNDSNKIAKLLPRS